MESELIMNENQPPEIVSSIEEIWCSDTLPYKHKEFKNNDNCSLLDINNSECKHSNAFHKRNSRVPENSPTYMGWGLSHGNYFISWIYVNGSQTYMCCVECLQA